MQTPTGSQRHTPRRGITPSLSTGTSVDWQAESRLYDRAIGGSF